MYAKFQCGYTPLKVHSDHLHMYPSHYHQSLTPVYVWKPRWECRDSLYLDHRLIFLIVWIHLVNWLSWTKSLEMKMGVCIVVVDSCAVAGAFSISIKDEFYERLDYRFFRLWMNLRYNYRSNLFSLLSGGCFFYFLLPLALSFLSAAREEKRLGDRYSDKTLLIP